MPSITSPAPAFDEPGDLFESRAFMDLGSCRGLDPDLFFPDRGSTVVPAKAVCTDCIVRDECLDYALDNNERFGVWGGTSERERRRLRRTRRQETKIA
jgi:WhiB family redox-sensing transcriptional regulator